MQKKAMPEEDRVNIVDALRGQQEQVKRLTAQKMWISDSTKATLSEIKAQLGELKRLLTRLESDIRDQLKKRTGTQPMRQRSPKASAKARDLADQEIDKISDQSASAEDRQERKRRLLMTELVSGRQERMRGERKQCVQHGGCERVRG